MPDLPAQRGPEGAGSADMRAHLLAGLIAAAVVAAALLALGGTLLVAGGRDHPGGALVAVFPPRTPEAQAFARVARAGGVVMNATWLAGTWQVYGEDPGFAAALRAQGALLVLPPPSIETFSIGACGGTAIARHPAAPGRHTL